MKKVLLIITGILVVNQVSAQITPVVENSTSKQELTKSIIRVLDSIQRVNEVQEKTKKKKRIVV